MVPRQLHWKLTQCLNLIISWVLLLIKWFSVLNANPPICIYRIYRKYPALGHKLLKWVPQISYLVETERWCEFLFFRAYFKPFKIQNNLSVSDELPQISLHFLHEFWPCSPTRSYVIQVYLHMNLPSCIVSPQASLDPSHVPSFEP